MIKRIISKKLLELSKKIPVLSITGPRQSGKTTLVKNTFPAYKYVTLENPDNLEFAINDPKGFLNTFGKRVIIDEIQYAPKLFSYIQTIVDEKKENGLYVLTGSQNFLLNARISQSLAGRVIIFNLLPLSYDEIRNTKYNINRLSELIIKGFYPRIYSSRLNPKDWLPSYIQTYLERDVRQLLNVGDINIFRKFLLVCAGRCGQILNLSSIGNDLGISYQTVKKWLSVLEQSYIIYFLHPYFENFKKRIIKSPKLYFYDTGLLCNLLGIYSPEAYEMHYLKGGIFESFVISELLKRKYNTLSINEFYYWRDSNGNEIDCIITDGSRLKAIEIKAAETINSDFFKTLYLWNKLAPSRNNNLNLVYAGNENQKRKEVNIFSWNNCSKII